MQVPIQSQPIVRVSSFPRSIVNGIQPSWNCDSKCKWYQPDCYAWKAIWCTTEGKFARCMGFPNVKEAGTCIAAVLKCAPTAAGGPAYGVCVGALCGAAGAAHSYRCAKESGLI